MLTGAIILAAGKGTRMKSDLPKVLHKVGGTTMIQQVLAQVEAAQIGTSYLVVGHGADQVKAALGENLLYAIQRPQLGTGHCVIQAIPLIPIDTKGVLVVCGDTPLLRSTTLAALKASFLETNAACTVLTAIMPNPTGYGRIIRNPQGEIVGIVEEKDATPAQKEIKEVNTGTYFFNYHILTDALASLNNNNAQGEYYLTDTISFCVAAGHKVVGVVVDDPEETMGVNDKAQLAQADLILKARKNQELLQAGVTLIDPPSIYVDVEVEVGEDTIIYPNCHLRGKTKIGKGCVIDADCQITNSIIGNNCNLIKTVINQSVVGDNANIGPFAYLRPGTVLGDNVKVGDFVEVKKSVVGDGSKIPHLSYVGDAVIGKKVNIGCGTITCNYDGANKYETKIDDGAFIGSNTNLVAPVTVGEKAFVAAGSTITSSVEPGDLAVARGKQKNIKNWVAENAPKKA